MRKKPTLNNRRQEARMAREMCHLKRVDPARDCDKCEYLRHVQTDKSVKELCSFLGVVFAFHRQRGAR